MNEAYSRLKFLLAEQGLSLEALQEIPTQKQARLDELMELHSERQLDSHLLSELQSLVDEANELELGISGTLSSAGNDCPPERESATAIASAQVPVPARFSRLNATLQDAHQPGKASDTVSSQPGFESPGQLHN